MKKSLLFAQAVPLYASALCPGLKSSSRAGFALCATDAQQEKFLSSFSGFLQGTWPHCPSARWLLGHGYMCYMLCYMSHQREDFTFCPNSKSLVHMPHFTAWISSSDFDGNNDGCKVKRCRQKGQRTSWMYVVHDLFQCLTWRNEKHWKLRKISSVIKFAC